jgi:hypothetical protein
MSLTSFGITILILKYCGLALTSTPSTVKIERRFKSLMFIIPIIQTAFVLTEHGKLLFLFYFKNPMLATGSNPVLEALLFPTVPMFETLSSVIPFDEIVEMSAGTSKLLSLYVFMFAALALLATIGYIVRAK